MVESPFNELVLYKKSFSALFKILCSAKNSVLRPSVQIKEIFSDELRHLKVNKSLIHFCSINTYPFLTMFSFF